MFWTVILGDVTNVCTWNSILQFEKWAWKLLAEVHTPDLHLASILPGISIGTHETITLQL